MAALGLIGLVSGREKGFVSGTDAFKKQWRRKNLLQKAFLFHVMAAQNPADLMALEGVHLIDCLRLWPELADIDIKLHSQLETDCRYSGYLARQQADIEAMRRDDGMRIPQQTTFSAIGGLSAESCDLLQRYQPSTIGQASRIPGITPAALVAVLRYLKKDRTATSSQTERARVAGQQSTP